MEVTCNPATKVGICASKKATGDCNWAFQAVSHNMQYSMEAAANDEMVKICGPGKFSFSPMVCRAPGKPDRFPYKAEHFTIERKENDDCRTEKLQHFAKCYSVDCAQ